MSFRAYQEELERTVVVVYRPSQDDYAAVLDGGKVVCTGETSAIVKSSVIELGFVVFEF